jgi:hypothetical protein
VDGAATFPAESGIEFAPDAPLAERAIPADELSHVASSGVSTSIARPAAGGKGPGAIAVGKPARFHERADPETRPHNPYR